ncbi:MAG TPA: dihydrofolate reductase [Solimonas sp.]|jgi:dihydrofolate reductase|nr:dihydrofolate reductase [Solimonas sp.]
MRSLSLVVAMDENRLIGRANGLPWRLPDDMKQFKRITLGHTVLMGRKTWDSLGRPLPERDNWVLTRERAFAAAGARVFHDLDDALAAYEIERLALTPPSASLTAPPSPAAQARGIGRPSAGDVQGELMVIGGADLYRQTLPHAQRIYLTEVQARIADGDAWFPDFDRTQFRETASEAHAADERHAYPFRFVTLERLAAQP